MTTDSIPPQSPFGIRNQIARVLWNMTYVVFFRFSPRPWHAWRSGILRLFGAQIGRRVHIYPKATIWLPCNLVCEDGAGVGDGAILYTQGLIHLGRDCIVSQGSHLCTGTHDYDSAEFTLITKPIRVSTKAWIAAECFVMPGVTIGEGAVIGARSVVTKDMPPWTICAGHPCRPIKAREKYPV